MDTQELLRSIRRFMKEQYPGYIAKTLKIQAVNATDSRDRRGIKIPVIGKKPSCQVLSGAIEKMQESEAHILAAVPDFDKPVASSRKIAKDSGYKYNSWFRTLLGQLRKKGKVIMDGAGYKKAK